VPARNELPADLEAAHRRIAELSTALDAERQEKARVANELGAALEQVSLEKARLAEKLEAALHRLKTMLREKFGRKSERIAPGQNVLAFPGVMEELEQAGANAADIAAFKEDLEAELKPHPASPEQSRGVRQATLDESLPLEEKTHDLPAEDKACDKCGSAMTQIDAEESVQLEFVPATFKRIRHRRLKYACKACGECVKLAERPLHPIMKGLPGPGLLAQTLNNKYDDHLPLNRQQEIYARHGVHVPRSSLCDWVRQSCLLLEPLYEFMCMLVLQGKVIQADETPVNFRLKDLGNACEDIEGDSEGDAHPKSKAKARLIQKGYMWVYNGDAEHPYCCFDFTENRTKQGPLKFLNHAPLELLPGEKRPPPFQGHLQADAYGGYDEVFRTKDDQGKPLVLEVACWAHARRKFFDAQESKDRDVALAALKAIGEFYSVEHKLADIAKSREERGRAKPSYEQIAKFRQRRAKPLLEKFGAWLEQAKMRVLPKDPLGMAISYALSNWTALNRYTEQGYLNIDNNASERALRNVVIGRKNWLVAGSRRGGRWAAIAYTLIESAKRCGANVWEYMRDLLENFQSARPSEFHKWLPEQWLKAKLEAANANKSPQS
jgi:transposase